jgi:hypothetical protein
MPDQEHILMEGFDGRVTCTCGLYFPEPGSWAALDHALPIFARQLADDVKADPDSSPELIARTEDLVRRTEGDGAMTDPRQDKLAVHYYTSGLADTLLFAQARAQSDISAFELAGLGVFDPRDEKLVRALATALQQEISSSLPEEKALQVAAELLVDLREANIRG